MLHLKLYKMLKCLEGEPTVNSYIYFIIKITSKMSNSNHSK